MTKDEAMLKLRDELLAVEQDRANGIEGYTIDEVEKFLDEIIAQSEEKVMHSNKGVGFNDEY